MKHVETSYAKRIGRWLVITTLAIVGLHLLFQQINLNVFHQQNGYFFELSNRFDMDDESSIPTWFAQVLFLLIAGAAAFAALAEKIKAKRVLWIIIALISTFLSIDEVAGIHEQVLQTIHVLLFHESAPTLLANAWLVILPIVLLAIVLLGKQMIKHFPARLLFVLGAGAGVFLTGAIGVDIVTQGINIPDLSLEFLQQGLFVGIEESLELTGAVIVLYGIMEYIENTHNKKIAAVVVALKK